MSGLPIVNGEQTFLDINGDPLSGGSVFFYVPGTTDPATTWVDSGLTVANSNPIILDQAGRAIIWGDGLYRQVVQDQFGNKIWDQTTAAGLGAVGGLVVGGNLVVNGLTASVINGGLVVNPQSGQLDAAVFNGGVQVNGDLALQGLLRSAPGVTGGIATADSMVIQATPGQLDALVVKGDMELDGSDGGTTYSTGQRFSVKGSNIPGFVAEDTTAGSGSSYGMWVGTQKLIWGSSDGAPDGSPVTDMMWLDAGSNLTVTEYVNAVGFNQTSDENLKRDIQLLEADGVGIIRNTVPRRYKIGKDEKEHWGFTAQDLSNSTDGAIGTEGTISLGDMLAVVWRALQQIDHRLTTLQETVRSHGVNLEHMTRHRDKDKDRDKDRDKKK